jgi:peroxiredoxin
MLPLGTTLPSFSLPDVVTGKIVTPEMSNGKPILVAFLCNHCPFVIHLRKTWVEFAREFKDTIEVLAISSNDVGAYPADGPEKMKDQANRWNFSFPYLFDETQSVAKAFRAACTPDFFLFNAKRTLVYRGQFDDSRPESSVPVSGADLRAACEAVLKGEAPSVSQKASLGCNIKWKPGNEPDYFLN